MKEVVSSKNGRKLIKLTKNQNRKQTSKDVSVDENDITIVSNNLKAKLKGNNLVISEPVEEASQKDA